jgi:hypothetical protein
MFQYYLREPGLMLSWIGTGPADLQSQLFGRRLRRSRRPLRRGGAADARGRLVDRGRGLSNKQIRRSVMTEALKTRLIG